MDAFSPMKKAFNALKLSSPAKTDQSVSPQSISPPDSSRRTKPRAGAIHHHSTKTKSWLDKFPPLLLVLGLGYSLVTSGFRTPEKIDQTFLSKTDHLIPPTSHEPVRVNVTLREFLLDPEGFHLGMAPAFFGYYGYFGSLSAWEDELSNSSFSILKQHINSLAGASAGAMTAILLASGISPRDAAEFCTTISLKDFADFPGLLTVFRGNKFQDIMHDYMSSQRPNSTLLLQDAEIPVAVSGFDLLTMEGKILTRGNMARAARASACFPFLFQPVGWVDKQENFLFTDGGVTDSYGLNGLAAFGHEDSRKKRRIINLNVGNFHMGTPLGPSQMPEGVEASEVVSISLRNLPQCGPWAMSSGPLAVDGARLAMRKALDLPMYAGKEEGHYELHIDTSSFVSDNK